MTTPIEAIEPIQAISPVKPIGMPSAERIATTGTAPHPAAARFRSNLSILQASVDVSINSGNESLALLLQSAIGAINDILEPKFGKSAIQNAASQDNTPQGTAERIVSLSTGFYEVFKQQYAGEAEADMLRNFMATIRRGFEHGYKEARNILQGMNVLGGDIDGNIEKTYALVLQGYADFAALHSIDQFGAAVTPRDK